MTMVNITQEDIDNGMQGHATSCAIAQSLRRVDVFNKEDLQRVWVGGTTVFRVGDQVYEMPKKAQDFVKKFDGDKSTVKPFSFALRKHKVKTFEDIRPKALV